MRVVHSVKLRFTVVFPFSDDLRRSLSGGLLSGIYLFGVHLLHFNALSAVCKLYCPLVPRPDSANLICANVTLNLSVLRVNDFA